VPRRAVKVKRYQTDEGNAKGSILFAKWQTEEKDAVTQQKGERKKKKSLRPLNVGDRKKKRKRTEDYVDQRGVEAFTERKHKVGCRPGGEKGKKKKIKQEAGENKKILL